MPFAQLGSLRRRAGCRDWKATAQRWRSIAATALMAARVERGRLYYGSDIFAKGDSVAIFSELTKQEFFGVVHILSPNEVRAAAPGRGAVNR
jgi:hypothetical protein